MPETIEVHYYTDDSSVAYEKKIPKEDLGRWILDQFAKAKEGGHTFHIFAMYDN